MHKNFSKAEAKAILMAMATAGLAAHAGLVVAQDVRSGAAAYGDWRSDAPGVMRKITPGDLPENHATPSTANVSQVVAKPAGAQLKAMKGFTVAPLIGGFEGARVIRAAPNGDVFVSLSRPTGKIMIIRSGDNMGGAHAETFATDLKDPYGIAFYPPGPKPEWVYVAASGKIVRYPYQNGALKPTGKPETVVSGLPVGGHWTRDIAFSNDGKIMYVAVGSGSNIAENMGDAPADIAAFEQSHAPGAAWGKEEWRAAVLTYDPNGKNRQIYATGIRNCAGLTLQPVSGTVYCATNERDLLGDDLPPDYVTSVAKGGFYGWPWYYIGQHEDTRPQGGRRPDLASKVLLPDVLLQPHSAPLGMAFNPGGQFPSAWKGDAFVALHGSWNRALRTGYKVVRLPFKNGKATGEYQDFVVGFGVSDGDVWGRPVDVAFAADGSMLFSDDGNGVIYRVTYD
jgi:glucose/arabinose dehydrogenase